MTAAVVNAAKMNRLVDKVFQFHETFPAWYSEISRSFPKFESDFRSYCRLPQALPENPQAGTDDNNEDWEESARFSAVPFQKKQCCTAFVDIKNEDFKSAADLLKEATKQIGFCVENKYLKEEYVKGFEYVVYSLKLYCSFTADGGQGNWDENVCSACIKDLNLWDKLNGKEKAAVLSVKLYFVKYVSWNSFDEQIKICKKVNSIL